MLQLVFRDGGGVYQVGREKKEFWSCGNKSKGNNVRWENGPLGGCGKVRIRPRQRTDRERG